MNTGYSVRNDYQMLHSQKSGIKASNTEIMHDLQQMSGEPIKNMLKKQSKEIEAIEKGGRPKVRYKKRSKGKLAKANELACALLGFASFMNEVQHHEPSEKPVKKQKTQPKFVHKKKPLPPFLVTQPSNNQFGIIKQMPIQNQYASYMNIIPRLPFTCSITAKNENSKKKQFPPSAIHVRIARMIHDARKKKAL